MAAPVAAHRRARAARGGGGDRVLRGQLAAKKAEGLSANVYAPIAGTVKGVVRHITAGGKKQDHILIEGTAATRARRLPPSLPLRPKPCWRASKRRASSAWAARASPTAAKLNVRGRVDTLVVNAAECEPYITCDERIMLEYTGELLQGIRLCMLACGAERAVIGIEKNKPEAIAHLARQCGEGLSVKPLRTRYPQGAESSSSTAAAAARCPKAACPPTRA